MFQVEWNGSTKSYDRSGRRRWENSREERPILCKVRIERRICHLRFRPLFLPVHFSRSGGSQLGFFSFGDIDFRPLSFERGVLLLNARVKGSRTLGANFSKPRIKRRIVLYDQRKERRGEDEGEEEAAEDRERKWGRGRTKARIYSALFKRGDSLPPLPPPRLWDTMMKLFRPPSLRKWRHISMQ